MNKRLYVMLAFLVGCTTTGTRLENIPLVWKPTTSAGSMGSVDPTYLGNAKLQVDRAADNRENRGFIGQNREEQTPRDVTTRDDVAAFVTERMKALISRAGINVVDSGGTAILQTEIRQFFVDETETYQGEVLLRVTLTDPAGKVLWSGIAGGTASRFGRSYSADNYYETLSDALIGATHQLVHNAGFRNALAGQ